MLERNKILDVILEIYVCSFSFFLGCRESNISDIGYCVIVILFFRFYFRLLVEGYGVGFFFVRVGGRVYF